MLFVDFFDNIKNRFFFILDSIVIDLYCGCFVGSWLRWSLFPLINAQVCTLISLATIPRLKEFFSEGFVDLTKELCDILLGERLIRSGIDESIFIVFNIFSHRTVCDVKDLASIDNHLETAYLIPVGQSNLTINIDVVLFFFCSIISF